MSTIAGPDQLTKDSIEADLLLWIDDHLEAQRDLVAALGKDQTAEAEEKLTITRDRMHAARDALRGHPAVYVQYKIADVAKTKPVSAVAAAPAEPEVKQSERLDFDKILEVAQLSRRLALEDYHRHVQACLDAQLPHEVIAANDKLQAAMANVRLTDEALVAVVKSAAAHRETTTHLVVGAVDEAKKTAQHSADGLNIVADRLDRYGVEAPKSGFFKAAFEAVAKADQVAGRVQADIARHAEAFSSRLRAFAGRVREFGNAVARMPETVATVAKDSGKSMAETATLTYNKLRTGIAGWFGRTADKVVGAVAEGKAKAKQTAWDTLERMNVGVEAQMVVVAAERVASLGGGVLSKVADKVSSTVADIREEAQVARKARMKP
ncbi:hypothetical protein ABIC83_002458 [Roseateles asaccharophilus]|uniref:hypothetical protein n=1 Tax=Roseateles asaccharophilus TaxID=582607 RepID=UPI0038323752